MKLKIGDRVVYTGPKYDKTSDYGTVKEVRFCGYEVQYDGQEEDSTFYTDTKYLKLAKEKHLEQATDAQTIMFSALQLQFMEVAILSLRVMAIDFNIEYHSMSHEDLATELALHLSGLK